MDEGCGDDDAGTEVFGDEESPFGDADASVAGGEDGEDGACAWVLSVWRAMTDEDAKGGKASNIPNMDPMRMTKMAEMRTPIRPSYSLSSSQAGVEGSGSAAPAAAVSPTWRMTRSAIWATTDMVMGRS